MTYPVYVQELIELTYDMWHQGWDEYNGGNISYLLNDQEVRSLAEDFAGTDFKIYDDGEEAKDLLTVPSNMHDRYLLITASGSHFRNLKDRPAQEVGIIKVTETGYQVKAEYNRGKKPTSEVFMHILSHGGRLQQNPEHCVVVHNHATNIALYSLLNEVASESRPWICGKFSQNRLLFFQMEFQFWNGKLQVPNP